MEGLRYKHTGSEKDIEMHITENVHDIASGCHWPEVSITKNQFPLPLGKHPKIADIFIRHTDNTGTIVEIKKYRNLSEQIYAIGQVLLYGELVCVLLGNYPRLVIASDYINPILKAIISRQRLPIKTMQIDGDRVEYF